MSGDICFVWHCRECQKHWGVDRDDTVSPHAASCSLYQTPAQIKREDWKIFRNGVLSLLGRARSLATEFRGLLS